MKNTKLMLGDNIQSLKKLTDIDQKYSISPEGYIINTITNKLVCFNPDKKGYMKARLYSPLSKNSDGRKPYRLHRLIAKAFLSNFSDDLQVNHLSSGSTGIAALLEGFKFVGMELDADYFKIAEARIESYEKYREK